MSKNRKEKDNITVFPANENIELDKEIEETNNQEQQVEEPKKKEEPKEDLATQYLNMAKQIQADFDNYRKRTVEDIKKARIDGLVDAVKTLLPAIDVFENALKQITDENSKQGVLMIKNQIEKSIQDLGVTKIECLNKKFDPNFHNAVLTQCNPELEDEIVTDEYSSGYMFKDKVIRYSQVRVNKLN